MTEYSNTKHVPIPIVERPMDWFDKLMLWLAIMIIIGMVIEGVKKRWKKN